MKIDAKIMPLLREERSLFLDFQRFQRKSEEAQKGRNKKSRVRWSRIAEEVKKELRELRKEIVEVARRDLPGFNEIAKALGLDDDDIDALAALAGLLVYLDYPEDVPMSIRKKINYLGLFKAKDEKSRSQKKCNRRPARYLNTLAMIVMWKRDDKRMPRLKDLRSTLKELIRIANALNGLFMVKEGARVKALAARMDIFLSHGRATTACRWLDPITLQALGPPK